MRKGVSVKDLPEDLRRELEPTARAVPGRLVTLGKVLQALEGLSRRDALWVLRKAIRELGAERRAARRRAADKQERR